MQKIKEYKVRQDGRRGMIITLPKVFITDNNFKHGDSIEIYRETINGRDVLVIMKKKEQ